MAKEVNRFEDVHLRSVVRRPRSDLVALTPQAALEAKLVVLSSNAKDNLSIGVLKRLKERP